MFFLQYCILFPLWLFSQSSVAYVHKAEVLSLLVFDLLPQLLHIREEEIFLQMHSFFPSTEYRKYKIGNILKSDFKRLKFPYGSIFLYIVFRKVVFSDRMLHSMTFSECQNTGEAKLP